MNLGDIIEHNAALFPAKDAVVDERSRITFAELADRAKRLANALAARGVRPGDRVAIFSANRRECIETFGACDLAGYISVSLNARSTAQELDYLLGDCTPAALLFEESRAALVAKAGAAGAVRNLIALRDGDGTAAQSGAEDYDTLVAAASADRPSTSPAPDDTAFIVYTSGTTGRPKGVMQGHRAQVLSALAFCVDGQIDATDRILISNPLFHSGGRWMHLGHQFRGCTTFLHRRFDPAVLLATIEREKITATLLPATMMRAVLEQPDFARYDLSSLRTVYYSAGPTPVPLIMRAIEAFGPILVQYYGGTEAGGVGTALLKHHHVGTPSELRRRLESAGQPKPLAKVRVIRPDGTDCAVEEPGEIIIHSDAHMQGYWNKPEATAETLIDGWIYTGDIGVRDAESFIYILDRKKEMIISGGTNIYPREVEDALQMHPAVREAAVFGVPDEKWGETVHAVIAIRPGSRVTSEELIEHCRSLIASYKKPTSITFVDALPQQENGKIDKLSLRDPFWAGRARRVN
jgi:acyl-CoA synthetase (AMP-forming)/AMP-acid ligase II